MSSQGTGQHSSSVFLGLRGQGAQDGFNSEASRHGTDIRLHSGHCETKAKNHDNKVETDPDDDCLQDEPQDTRAEVLAKDLPQTSEDTTYALLNASMQDCQDESEIADYLGRFSSASTNEAGVSASDILRVSNHMHGLLLLAGGLLAKAFS